MPNNNTFFISWPLWQQMTFALGSAIFIVFCAGLIKLWWLSLYLKKQEKLDSERRTHIRELQKSGLQYRANFDIPFGVRAIQSGIEVDGIWISRSNTPVSSPKLQSQATLVELDGGKGKGKIDDSDASSPQHRPVSNVQLVDVPPLSPRIITGPQGGGAQEAYRPRQPTHNRVASQADALRQLEGRNQAAQRPMLDTYIPTSVYGQAISSDESGRFGDRSSNSSSEYETTSESGPSQPATRSLTPVGQQQYNVPNSTLSASTRRTNPNRSPRQGSPNQQPRNPFTTPHDQQQQQFQQQQAGGPQVPRPTFGPGDVHANRQVRKVNSNFEVLPAGALGERREFSSHYSSDDTDLESQQPRGQRRGSQSRPRNKLQKNQPQGPPPRGQR